jgi:hypothetical protein
VDAPWLAPLTLPDRRDPLPHLLERLPHLRGLGLGGLLQIRDRLLGRLAALRRHQPDAEQRPAQPEGDRATGRLSRDRQQPDPRDHRSHRQRRCLA